MNNTILSNTLNTLADLNGAEKLFLNYKFEGNLINNETGEISTPDIILESIRQERFNQISKLDVFRKNKDNRKKYVKNKGEFEGFIRDNLGSFYLTNYVKLLDEIDIDRAIKFRFMYICAFADYDNRLTTGETSSKRCIREDELDKMLNLGKREAIYTKEALIKAGLISIEGGAITVSRDFIKRGNLKRGEAKKLNGNYSRVFVEGIQVLYESSNPREHKKLFMLLEMLPYLNYTYNVLCHNPEENIEDLVRPYEVNELAIKLGYDKTHTSRFKRDILSIKIGNEMVFGIVETSIKRGIVVNPKLFYKGRDLEAMKSLLLFFKPIVE